MSTFAVFGVTLEDMQKRCMGRARMEVKAQDDKRPKGQLAMPALEFERAVVERAKELAKAQIESAQPVQLSGWLDSPAFAREIISLTQKQSAMSRGLCVKVRKSVTVDGKRKSVIESYAA